jgi:ABC-2 type transport system ATP-binding protein/bacitracin transport system ATP-binding protein
MQLKRMSNIKKKGEPYMENIIETENLTKQYGTSTVVNRINIHVPKGKIYGLLGRNGAGKTTAMKIMLQLVHPSNGTIKLFGTDYRKNTDEVYKKIGSIIETPGFYGNLTAYENLNLLGRLRGIKKKDSIYKALEVVGLQTQQRKPFSEYSLGMKQRLGIAAAIMHEPELLILDEPINGLDPIGISEIRSFLFDLSHTKGTTILISSHVLSEIEQIADIIGIIHEGHLIEEVNMAELHKRKRKYIEFVVSDAVMAAKLLENDYGIIDYSIQSNTIKIFDCTHNCGEINRIFIENGFTVTKLNLCEEHLEDYFSDLIGGSGIA